MTRVTEPEPARRPALDVAIVDLGFVDYAEAVEIQRRQAGEREAGRAKDTLFLLEHPHVITCGRNAREENLRVAREELARRGVALHESSRGGDVTYHGPGQLVGYPVLQLPPGRRDVHAYVRDLEEVLIRALADFGLTATRDPKHPGVWIGRNKIGALGVHIARWTTTHGFALNVATELRYFELITPCGIQGRGVTSLASELGAAPAMGDVKAAVGRRFREVFG